MSNELTGKVAIITGGASGIGRGTVEVFVEEGARVVVADVDTERGEAVAARFPGAALFKRTDVSKAADLQAVVDFAVGHCGGLHVMFNNAGIMSPSSTRFLDDDFENFQREIDVNLRGVILGSQFAARHMVASGGGSIINTSSIAGIQAGYAFLSYRAAKAAVAIFSQSIAIDLAEHGVRVNCLAPGHILTEMTSATEPELAPEVAERLAEAMAPVWSAGRPLKRQGMPRDVAKAALFLASDMSAQITGVVLPVDGGITAGDPVNHLQRILDTRAKVLGPQ